LRSNKVQEETRSRSEVLVVAAGFAALTGIANSRLEKFKDRLK
jgi:hypothetical protein